MSTSLFLCTLALVAALATPASAFGPRPHVPQPADDVDPMAVDPAVMDYLKQANLTSESGNHLWFYWVSTNGQSSCQNGACRCGDIDAAARMPDELFKPQNLLALARYATLTIKSYSSLGMGSEKLKLGRCSQETKYSCGGSGVQGINWVTGALMGPICKKQCDCNYPSCQDQPDDPAAGKFCSLCGPKYNGYITINLWNLPNTEYDDDDSNGAYGPCGQPLYETIPDTVKSNPDLSTLYAALKAADLFKFPSPATLFAPTNKAFAALPPFTLAKLLKPENKAQLVDLLTYHVKPDSMCVQKDASTRYCSSTFKDGDTLRTVEGKTVAVHQSYVGRPPYQSKVTINGAAIVTADVRARGGVVQIIDSVLLPPQTIVDLAVATPDLSTLVTAVQAAGLVSTLSGPGPFTVFAPTNEAFAKLPSLYLQLLLDPKNIKTLQKLLTYHVVKSAAPIFSRDLTNGERIDTVEGQAVTVAVSKKVLKTTVKIDDAIVTTADVAASNGVVHIVDTVLMPPDMPPMPDGKSIVDLAVGTPDLSTLVTALNAADLVSTLSGPGPFTVFAPTNEAFAALPAGTLANLLKPENKGQLADVLTYHVVAGAVHAKDLKDKQVIKTVEGKTLTARVSLAGIFINSAKVTTADIDGSNGVVHIVDGVLMP